MIRKIVYDFLYLGDKILELVIFWFFVLALGIGVYALWDNQQIYQHADASLYGDYCPTEKTKVGFEELRRRNPEIRGWIRIDKTEISYPVVQGKDNYKYINKDAVGKDSLSGSIFMDYRNASDFSDPNIILYGHHMAKNTMFGELDAYTDLSFFESHLKGELYDGNIWHDITFFAFLRADAYDPVVYDVTTEIIGGTAAYADWLQKRALHWKEGMQIKNGQFITLSTCTSDGTPNGRYVLIGWMSVPENTKSRSRIW